jgi:geranylgeranyl reductase family protein
MLDVAIVGAGPAGSNCAYTLAKNNVSVTIFDHSHPREKPCGGMIGQENAALFPILQSFNDVLHSEADSLVFVSPRNIAWKINLGKNKLLGFSRTRFDQFLLQQALNKGASLVKEKVLNCQKNGDSWKITTQNGEYHAKTIIGADGTNSLLRRDFLGEFDKADVGGCFGYLFGGVEEKRVIIKFSSKIAGYLWVIPRGDHTSVGAGTMHLDYMHKLRAEVDAFAKTYSQKDKLSQWAALIPHIKDTNTFDLPVAGKNWALIGDAAGHVSPMSGSGIPYALMDGMLAAEAIAEGHIEKFNEKWKASYGRTLLKETRISKLIYQSSLLEFYCMYAKLQNVFAGLKYKL